ncbi:hypothetical protein NKR74_13455 [Bacillus sp. 3103sda1]|uniref:hypothetical protein n=1 Tax=Bacillus sp. 3103sda1 TaxID=2953808 RepID=UPI00209F5FB2|nr:hypothetical protein [Bacillus sp. 3103sda1]MCP1124301.1 hypothetical protein [Bacillus sp. 3103sda1]
MFRKISTAVATIIFAFTTFLFSDHAQAATSSTNSTHVSQDNSSGLVQTSEVKEESITAFSTRGLPWYFSYAFDSNLNGATRFYYDSSKGRLKVSLSSRTPYNPGYSGNFRVTIMKDPTVGWDYAVSHADYPRNGSKSVIYTYQYGGSRLPSGYYWLKFTNPHPWPYITGSGSATYY